MLRVEDENYVVKRFFNGKEARLHTDQTTKMSDRTGRGICIEAKVGELNNKKQVLSLYPIQ